MGGRDQSQVKIKSLKSSKKIKSIPKMYQKVITMTATPYRAANPSNVGATPREPGQVGATPLQTPMRDNLSINPDNGFSSAVQTPRENRM